MQNAARILFRELICVIYDKFLIKYPLHYFLYNRVTWTFSCEAHDKGSKNGIAGVVKNKITERILTKELAIKDADESAKY